MTTEIQIQEYNKIDRQIRKIFAYDRLTDVQNKREMLVIKVSSICFVLDDILKISKLSKNVHLSIHRSADTGKIEMWICIFKGSEAKK